MKIKLSKSQWEKIGEVAGWDNDELIHEDRLQEERIKDAPVAKREKSSNWKASNTENGKYLGTTEFKADDGEYHDFEVIELPDRIVFGGVTNVGFMESGYILREEGESTDTLLQEMLSDLETYYNQGSQFVSRIVVNERM